MNKRRKVLITITYNEMGIIIDTKAEEVAQPNLQSTCNQLATDCISRKAAIDVGLRLCGRDTKAELINLCEASIADSEGWAGGILDYMGELEDLPSAQPETAKRIVGKSRNGTTLWYQCDMCNEPVDAQDSFCRGCGRRLTDG